jgi:predicted transcriptional regulator
MSGATKTRIIYDTKLNYVVVQKYLEMLIEKEFIRQENGRFITTAKGKTFQQTAMELKL